MSITLVPGGHAFYERDGGIDPFILDAGYHNGPGCEACFVTWCEHCSDDWKTAACPMAVLQ
jgi:hypothetical protein